MKPGSRRTERSDWSAIERWMVPVIVLVLLFVVLDTIVYTQSMNQRARTSLSATLPSNSGDTLRALILSTGQPCGRVCDIDSVSVSPVRAVYAVSCAAPNDPGACKSAREYVLTLEPPPVRGR
jgi:hypothetical protein